LAESWCECINSDNPDSGGGSAAVKKKINLHIGLYFPHIILFFEGGSDETPASLECSAARKGTLRRLQLKTV